MSDKWRHCIHPHLTIFFEEKKIKFFTVAIIFSYEDIFNSAFLGEIDNGKCEYLIEVVRPVEYVEEGKDEGK